MKPFAPAEMRFSTAATWLSLSPSLLPANDWTEAPSFLACAVAPSFIFTKNGLVSVLVIRPSLTLSPPPPPPPPPSSSPQAAMPAVSASAEPSAARRDALRPRLCALIFPSPPVQSPSSENVYRQALNYACSGMSSVSENVLRRACEPRGPGTAMVGRHGRSRRRRRAVAPARHCLSSSPASSSPCGVGSPNALGIELRRPTSGAANPPGSSAHRRACPALPDIPDATPLAQRLAPFAVQGTACPRRRARSSQPVDGLERRCAGVRHVRRADSDRANVCSDPARALSLPPWALEPVMAGPGVPQPQPVRWRL